MAAVVPCASVSVSMSGHIQNQLTRSLERILEDANLSGELKLSGRKLKDFPKTGKYDLSDTVIADLSKNRFGEVPDEVTAFYFLERLQLYHNAIRNIPDTIGMLQSLTYLDLSRNQLTEVPRELCCLPLQVLLVSHNRLTSLPKEIGKMQELAELDAAGNLINQLPMSIGDLRSLRALNLRSNQLGLLPLQITFLHLELLDVSCNCISSLPLELRGMTSLVVLNLDHNPLVSPPATVCVRGRIHIFKYLENQASKDTTHRRGGSATADEQHRRQQQQLRSTPSSAATMSNGGLLGNQTPLCPPAVEGLRHKARYNVDSGYSTSDGGEKRWSSDGIGVDEGGGVSGRSTPSTPSTLSPSPAPSHHNNNTSILRGVAETPPSTPLLGCRISPDGSNLNNGEDKSRLVNHQQTYRQYKEAQRQQRQQDVYRPRGETSPATSTPSPGTPGTQSHSTPNTLTHSSQHSPIANGYSHRSIGSSSPSLTSPSQSNNNSSSPAHSTPRKYQSSAPSSVLSQTNGLPNHNDQYNASANSYISNNQRIQSANNEETNKRPVQKVVPSRSNSMTTKSYSPTGVPMSNSNNSIVNGNGDYSTIRSNPDRSPTDGSYVKPVSPIKGSSGYMTHNNVPMNRSNSLGRTNLDSSNHVNGSDPTTKLLTTSVSYVGTSPTSTQPRINWNKDLPPDKLSFTMKREFDRAREESELIQQLRSIIENRLKMTLPRDLPQVLSDGVVLCHLANNVRPRAVASVHVPSPAQPKLTMARCRRNVDNFLEACRRIGVEEGAVCQPQDILQPEDEEQSLEAIYVTITRLLAAASKATTDNPPHATDNPPHATHNQSQRLTEVPQHHTDQLNYDTTNNIDEQTADNTNFNSSHLIQDIEMTGDDNTGTIVDNHNAITKNSVSEKFRNNLNFFQNKPSYRNRYAEDRCISNFNITSSEIFETEEQTYNQVTTTYSYEVYENNNAEASEVDFNKFSMEENVISKKRLSNVYPYNVEKNKINYVVPLVYENPIPSALKKVNYNADSEGANNNGSVITKRVRFFNDKRQSLNLDIKNNLNAIQNESLDKTVIEHRQVSVTDQDRFISNCCIVIFVATLVLLYLFPLPN